MRSVTSYEREDLRRRYNAEMGAVLGLLHRQGSVLRTLAHLGAAVALADLAADTERERALDDDETEAVYLDERARRIRNGDDVADWAAWEDPRAEALREWAAHARGLRAQIDEIIAEQEALAVAAQEQGKALGLHFGPPPEMRFVAVGEASA